MNKIEKIINENINDILLESDILIFNSKINKIKKLAIARIYYDHTFMDEIIYKETNVDYEVFSNKKNIYKIFIIKVMALQLYETLKYVKEK